MHLTPKLYSLREEKANSLTYALGLMIAIVATVGLIIRAVELHNGWAVFSFTVYGFGMMICMLSSTLYHHAQDPHRKAMSRHLDHANIYVLIAASYTPICLLLLREEKWWGWLLFGLVWFFAVIGIALNFRRIKTNSNLKTLVYVLMGLTLLIAIKPLLDVSRAKNCVDVLIWEAIGGVFILLDLLSMLWQKKSLYILCFMALCWLD